MSDTLLLQSVSEDVKEIRTTLEELRVSVEHRLTKVETRASLLGTIGGAITGFAMTFIHPWGR